MFRVLTVLLLVTSTGAGAANSVNTYIDLRNELGPANTLPEQRAIVERIRDALQNGTMPPGQAAITVYALSKKPVFNEEATISLLLQMIATPATAESATTGIAAQFRTDALSEQSSKILAEALHTYHRQQGLSDAGISNLQGALTPSTPQAHREYALEILLLRPPDDDKRRKFLNSVSYLIDPEVTTKEKKVALAIFLEAAEKSPLPEDVNTAVYRAATRDPDASVRVAAWPLFMQRGIKYQETDRGRYYSFGRDLSDQLTAELSGSKPSFAEADEETRERAVVLLNEYWQLQYPPEYIGTLIQLVDNHGSVASTEMLRKIRSANKLNDEQMAALAEISADRPKVEQAVESMIVPNLAPGSLVGPFEVIESSNDRSEWAAATKLLLEQHPDSPVPMQVADAAYEVVKRGRDYDAAAVDLMVRGDEPFAAREAKILKLVDRSPRYSGQIVLALQHLHGDIGYDFLVRRYANDKSIEETFRGNLLSKLYSEVRESGHMNSETTAAVTEFGRTADGYFSITTASRMLEASGTDIPWSIRIRQREFQWSVLGWCGQLALAIGAAAGLFLLVLIAMPGRKTGLTGAQRGAGFVLWLILVALFVGAAGLALLHSLGHNSSPPPDKAAPYYLGTLAIAIALAAVAFYFQRRRSPVATVGPAALTPASANESA